MTTPLTTQERAERWASTMRGHAAGDVRLAHQDSWAGPGSTSPLDRTRVRSMTKITWRRSPPARRAGAIASSKRSPIPYRTCFERDRDRILHSNAFRRLAGKTQVFVFPDDHQRTRLTHALEVAQVARSVSQTLGLNVALTEAIALGHDCGHGPGGHASEDALTPYVAEGYDHAVWGADVTLRAAQPVRRDARRRPQPLVEPSGTWHAGRRGRVVGRPHRLRVPRLRGCRRGRHRLARHAAGTRGRPLRGRAILATRHVRARR